MAEHIPLLAFTLTGPMGHFRKFYSNTSALTYPFPPPTTLRGLVAGLLGRRRDTYYEDLSSERLWIAVRMLTPVRIRTLTVNYLHTKDNPFQFYKDGANTQIPVGWVFPRPPHRCLRYRVYVSSPDPALWDELERTFTRRSFPWPPYLGITEALAWVEPDVWVGEVAYGLMEGPVALVTPVLQHPSLHLELTPGLRLLLDRMTLDFHSKPYRSPRKVVDVLYEETGQAFQARLSVPVFAIPEDPGVFGVFLKENGTGGG